MMHIKLTIGTNFLMLRELEPWTNIYAGFVALCEVLTSSWGDANQTGDHALNCSDDRRLAEKDDIKR